MTPNLPSLFLSHGAPDLILSDGPANRVLRTLGERLPRPRAILVVSAHWVSDPVGVTGGGDLPTIHDFSGFDDALYALRYPAQGALQLTLDVCERLDADGIATRVDETRGLDHGAWLPLALAYPDADIPVLQVSLPRGSLAACAELGRALQPLSEKGVLMLGSGGSVHNLRAIRTDGPPSPWAARFEEWLRETVESGNFDGLVGHARHPADLHLAHPTIEHLAPLVFSWAAGGSDHPGARFSHGFTYGNLGMSCYLFGGPESQRLLAPAPTA